MNWNFGFVFFPTRLSPPQQRDLALYALVSPVPHSVLKHNRGSINACRSELNLLRTLHAGRSDWLWSSGNHTVKEERRVKLSWINHIAQKGLLTTWIMCSCGVLRASGQRKPPPDISTCDKNRVQGVKAQGEREKEHKYLSSAYEVTGFQKKWNYQALATCYLCLCPQHQPKLFFMVIISDREYQENQSASCRYRTVFRRSIIILHKAGFI